MPEVLIEAASPYGFMVGGVWKNIDKESGIDPKAFHKGDAIDVEYNGKGFITSVVLKTAAPPKPAFKSGFGGGGFKPESPEKSAKMARGAAVKAVFGSQTVYDLEKNKSEGDAFKHMLALTEEIANYIEKGL